MTATDPRPALAAVLAERLGPAAEALAMACARDADPEPPPPDDRARTDRHRAARARLAHLGQLLKVLDWAARHLPEPEPAGMPSGIPDHWLHEPEPEEDGYDGSEDEFHYRSEVYVGSQETPEFRAWYAEQERRFGLLVPDEDDYDGSEDECHIGNRRYVGKLTTPEFRAWEERQMRREEEEYADRFDPDEDGPDSGGRDGAAARLHDIL